MKKKGRKKHARRTQDTKCGVCRLWHRHRTPVLPRVKRTSPINRTVTCNEKWRSHVMLGTAGRTSTSNAVQRWVGLPALHSTLFQVFIFFKKSKIPNQYGLVNATLCGGPHPQVTSPIYRIRSFVWLEWWGPVNGAIAGKRRHW